MSTGLQFDEELVKIMNTVHLLPEIVILRGTMIQALALHSGEQVLDVGSGPGVFLSEIAASVGPSGRVCGVDFSEEMVSAAQNRCADQPWVDVRVADATQLPFEDGTFDVIISNAVLEYVPDLTTALSEIYRVLRVGGRVLIGGWDWGSVVWHSSDHDRMARILKAFEEHSAHPYFARSLAPQLRQAGFEIRRQEPTNLFDTIYDKNTVSYLNSKVIASFVPGRQNITQDEVDAWSKDLQMLGENNAWFFSSTYYLTWAVKSGA